MPLISKQVSKYKIKRVFEAASIKNLWVRTRLSVDAAQEHDATSSVKVKAITQLDFGVFTNNYLYYLRTDESCSQGQRVDLKSAQRTGWKLLLDLDNPTLVLQKTEEYRMRFMPLLFNRGLIKIK